MQPQEQEMSNLELDLLLLFYARSDQWGVVDVPYCQQWAKERFGIEIPSKPFTLTQQHIDVLVKHNILPNVKALLEKSFKD